MNYIPITKISINYSSEHKHITAQQFKGAFTAYVKKHLEKKLQKNKIPFSLAYNRDEKGKPLQRYVMLQFAAHNNTVETLAVGKAEQIPNLWLKRILKKNDFTINGKTFTIHNIEKKTTFWFPEILKKTQFYKITAWKPFNTKTIGDENRFNKIIWGNIHRFLSDNNIKFNKKVNINIIEYKRNEDIKGYKINWINYDVIFSTNINLPENIGIGHEISIGSGKIQKIQMF